PVYEPGLRLSDLLNHLTVHPPHPKSTLFPYTTLFRSRPKPLSFCLAVARGRRVFGFYARHCLRTARPQPDSGFWQWPAGHLHLSDRKSTRLNSSHLGSSYAVFCLKNKIHRRETTSQLD